jgi:phospholipase C
MARILLAALAVTFGLSACGVGSTVATPGGSQSLLLPQAHRHHSSSHYIKHVIIMIQENRSFNDLFATFPGADGATTGKMKEKHGDKKVKLKPVNLVEPCDFGHSYKGFTQDYDGGKMDGFNLESSGKCNGLAGKRPYQYVNPEQIAPYWDIADQYVLGDHMFQTEGSGSYTAHQDLIRGNTTIDQYQTQSMIDDPSAIPWGCDAPAKTTEALLKWTGSNLVRTSGPFPCTNAFPGSGQYYSTMRDLLDANLVTWKYYSPPVKNGVGEYWNAFDTIASVRYSSEWGTNVTTSSPYEKQIFSDITAGALPQVSWLIPDDGNSDHPGSAADRGPSWIASVVNAIGTSQYWDSTAIIVVWDDWGGFYDNVPPAFFDHWGGLGFRVPMMVVSAYARLGTGSQGGYISHTQYEFGSILKFIEDNWNLGSLHTGDARATSIVDCFDFTQQPRTFTPIPSSFSQSYFEKQRPTFRPIDSE